MIQDACMGKFQMILTKEVSRFSRNILDTIAYTRKLNAHGVGVVFLNDGIDTRSRMQSCGCRLWDRWPRRRAEKPQAG